MKKASVFKRLFDVFFSSLGIILLIPFALVIAIMILIDSKGPVLYLQSRIGKDKLSFYLLKFRTMFTDSDTKGYLTLGQGDSRITSVGYWLRRIKLDELPQLLNVLKGDMSLVGPRPEVKTYVDLYSKQQQKVLTVRPGITDWASVKFRNENELIVMADNPEAYYIEKIMPAKLKMNLEYIERMNPWIDFKIILLTLFPFLKSKSIKNMENKIDIKPSTNISKT